MKKTNVKYKRYPHEKNLREGQINRDALTSGLARREQVPTRFSEVRVHREYGHDLISLDYVLDESGNPIGQKLLDEGLRKRDLIAQRQISLNMSVDVFAVTSINLSVRSKTRGRILSDPKSTPEFILKLALCNSSIHKPNEFRAILDNGNWSQWASKSVFGKWSPCNPPTFQNQDRVDDSVNELMCRLG